MTTAGRLTGLSALVTGGSRGIGFAIAQAFVREGADVMLAATSEDALRAAHAELKSSGRKVGTVAIDVARPDDCQKAVDATIESLGRLDVLVNAAGIYTPRSFLQYSVAEFDRLMQVNLHGPFHMMQLALAHMASNGSGRVINIASTAGKWASLNQSAYNASKHGLIGLTRCAALEFAGNGITVNAICPGLVQTDMARQLVNDHAALGDVAPRDLHASLLQRVAQRRFIDPSECAGLAVYLASREAHGMTGQSIVIDGGMLFV